MQELKLTTRQKAILKFIERHLAKGLPFPSYSEIGEHFAITKPGVARHIKALAKKGFIHRSDERLSNFSLKGEGPSFPFVARIAAGAPLEVFAESSDNITFDHQYFGDRSLIALEVAGDSMTGDFIANGDIVLLTPQHHFDSRHIFAVRVRGETTLKRLIRKSQYIELIPSNPDYPTQRYPASEVEVIGKLKGSVRRY